MTLHLVTMSHSPLMDRASPGPAVRKRVAAALDAARSFIATVEPELVVVFGPDHYNGMFYDLMPPFAIGTAAMSLGDWDTSTGPLMVDADAARLLARAVLNADIDVAVSERMFVDHGFAQPLEKLFDGLDAVPVVPVFINSVAEPLGQPRRARLLGQAIGQAASQLGRRVLFLGSGGLSHDPPMPTLSGATVEVAADLVGAGRVRTPEQRMARELRVMEAAEQFTAGVATIAPLNTSWDREVLAVLAAGDFATVDGWTTDWFTEQAGHSSHETRTSIAAYAALSAAGPYRVETSYYEPIPEWVAGFAVTTASSVTPAAREPAAAVTSAGATR